MEQLHKLELLDENGKPMDSRIVATLRKLLSRFRRQFPTIRDEVEIVEVFERAGQGMARHERESGVLKKPFGYAWAALMIALGVLNLYIATQFSIEVWAWWISVGALGAKIVAGVAQFILFRVLVRRRLRVAAQGA